MTISEPTVESSDPEPVRRLEVFTGAGRQRGRSAADKTPIVAESYAPGETVSGVAGRYALAPEPVLCPATPSRPATPATPAIAPGPVMH